MPSPPPEPKRVERRHVVFTIYRALTVPHEKAIESHNKELAEFLDANYTVLGSGMTPVYIYSIVTKEVKKSE